MEWDDFLSTWNNLSICKKFETKIEGVRFLGEWSEGKSGGTPTSNNPEVMKAYATNPQYYLQINSESAKVYISLSQRDGRLVAGADS